MTSAAHPNLNSRGSLITEYSHAEQKLRIKMPLSVL